MRIGRLALIATLSLAPGLVYGQFSFRIGGREAQVQSSPDRHVYDKVLSARFDLTRNWNVKLEGHFIDGWGGQMYPNGFYTIDNPQGVRPQTNVLIIRTGWNF